MDLNLGSSEFLAATAAALLVGVICGVLSFFVVHRNMAFMSHGVAHSMVAGVGLALLMHWPVFWPALLVALLIAVGVGWVTRRGRLAEDSAIGIALSGTLALGIFLSARHEHLHAGDHHGGTHALESYLVGSLEHVLSLDLIWLVGFAILIVLLVAHFRHPLLMFTYDPQATAIAGYPIEKIRFSILIALAVAIALTMKIVGILLVGAFLIIPSATAGFWSVRATRVILLSVTVSLIGAVAGILLAGIFSTPPGATIILTMVGLFLVSRLLGPHRT